MTDKERDPEADGPENATDPEPASESHGGYVEDAEADIETLTEAEFDPLDAPDEMPVDRAIASASAETASRRRLRGTAVKNAPAPTAADDAVHIQDRVSSWFVVATVGVFVVIVAWSLLLGRNGLLTDVFATPRPIATPVATVIPSEAPSVAPSIAPSVSPSIAPSVAPSAAPSVAPESPGASASPAAS
jgi:hypothetical protein